MQVLIPAGGRGVRLRPLTNLTPKPLLPIGELPILTRIVQDLPPAIPVVVLVTPELQADFEGWLSTLPSGRSVRIYVERAQEGCPAGPVAAISACIRDLEIEDDVVVLMGDSILPFTLRDFLGGSPNGSLKLAAYELPDLEQARRFGVLEIDGADRALSFVEKPEHPQSPWVFTGCFYLPRRVIPEVHEIAASYPLQVGHLLGSLLQRGEALEVFRVTGRWQDIGTISAYLEAHSEMQTAGERDQLLNAGNSLSGVVYVHPEARVRNSRLQDCIVGAHADLEAADLVACVVGPGVRVRDRQANGKLISPEGEFELMPGAEAK